MSELSSYYQEMGGEEKVLELVTIFYDEMERNPAYETIRKLHPKNMKTSREKLFLFLSGWMGGPQLYVEKYGHPRLRARHLPFPIGEEERNQWIKCMNFALKEMKIKDPLYTNLIRGFFQVADFMRNK